MNELRERFQQDLDLYYQAHSNIWNLRLHHILIPCEALAFFCFVRLVIPKTGVSAAAWATGLLSLLLSPNMIGFCVLCYHVALPWLVERIQWRHAVAIWIASWSLQIGVGHWVLEGNQPNLANNEVSLLAATQSVLIAWSV